MGGTVATNSSPSVAIIGAGPAGLTAGYELQKRAPGASVRIFEADRLVGGIARTESYKGFRFDIGGHRFFTKIDEVEAMWREVLGEDFLRRPRMSRIYYRGRFFHYPLKLFNALGNIGAYESARILLSYLKWRIRPTRREDSFEDWVINRFGGRLYMHFFRSYTEKVWGIPPRQIQADWAAQRIKNLSLSKAVWNAVTGRSDSSSLIEEFDYPRLGPGMMWERTADIIRDQGGTVELVTRVARLHREGTRITALDLDGPAGRTRLAPDHVLNSMALRDLIECIDPPPPAEVLAAARRLKYRDFLIVALVLDTPDPFPDNWIYVHSGSVDVGRIQNFRAWSADMVPNTHQSCIGMEYFCHQDDGLWEMADSDLVAKAAGEIAHLGLAGRGDVADGTVIRQPKAYPLYDADYREALSVVSAWIDELENLQTMGRNGLHRYNNQDHSMLTAMQAARNILGAQHDLWSVNVERAYHEDFQRSDSGSPRSAAAS